MRNRRLLSAFLAIVMVLTVAFGSMPALATEEVADEVVEKVLEESKKELNEAEDSTDNEEETLVKLEGLSTQIEEVPDEFDVLREKWQYLAVGGDYNPEHEDMQGLLNAINSVAQDLLDRINPNPEPGWGEKDYLWPEYMLGNRGSAYNDSNNTQFSIRSLKFMALAYQTKGCDLYKNEELKTEILRGIAYIHDKHFKPGIEDNQYGNWFTWQIGGPIYFCETLLLMYDELTPEQIEAYAITARKGGADKTGTGYEYVGANALWRDRVRMYTGILLKNAELLTYVQNDAPTFMGYVTSGDGYYEDGTFMQHGDITYNGGYGKEAFTDVVHFLYMLDGSQWEITGPERDNYAHIVETTYVPFMYNGIFMDMVRGREITRTDTTDAYAGITIGLDVLLLSEILPQGEGDRLKGMVKAWMDNENAIETLNEGAGVAWYLFPVYNLSKTLEILSDDAIAPITNTGTSYTFGKGARTVHTTDKFTLGLSMYSSDIANYEVGDSNAKGWYTGIGETYIYTPDIGQYTFQKPTVNWNRLSGVTAVNGVKPGKHKNSSGFGGSTTLLDTYSTAGLTLPSANTQVSAKKSWFMFDDEVVAVGSGITSNHANKVETTIDNHFITGDNALIVNGESQPTDLGWSGAIEGVQWALIEGNVEGSNIGLYFPQETTLSAIRETRTGKWTDLGEYNVDETLQSANYLTTWIDHGTKPVNDGYAYVLLPGTTEAQVENYADSSDVEILYQNDDVHAVYEKTLNTLGANFWNDSYQAIDAMGVENYLSVDKASSVMVKEDDNRLHFAISDSTKRNSALPITVVINRAATGVVTKDSRVKVLQTTPFIKLEVNAKGSFGNPIEAEFSYKPLEVPGTTSITEMTLVDDTLRIEFTDAQRASSYQVVYGTGSGVYPDALAAPNTGVEIKGLNANTTYYFAVRGINDSGEGPLSEEKAYAIGNTRTLVDEYEDFSKVVSYSGGWAFDAGNPPNFNGDTTRIKRDETKPDKTRMEYITYYAPSPESFALTFYDYFMSKPEESTILKIFGSPNNEDWTELAITSSEPVPTNDQWKKIIYSSNGDIDNSMQFIKIEVSQNAKGWAPQLSRMEINYAWTSNRVVRDTMLNDSTAYEVAGEVAYTVGADFGGDTDVLVKNDTEEATILYSYTGLKTAELVAFRTKADGGVVTFASSQDGNTFTPVAVMPDVAGGDYGAYEKAVYSIPALEAGTNYLRLTLSGAADSIVLSDLVLSYEHQVAPIDKIRFQDTRLEAVMNYPLTPSVKVAPMNATGEIKYTISNKDVVTVDATTGTLEAKDFGTAVLTATVLGVGANVTAAIPVRTSENRALKVAATASSARSGYTAGNAVDGNYLTRWESNGGNEQWLQVDMTLSGEFNAIELNWQQYATKYEVQGSTNGVEWTTLFTETDGQGGNVWIEFETVKNYRYVKVIGTESPGNYSLYEFRVLAFGTKSGTEPVNLSIGKTATTSGNDTTNSNPQAAIDGNTDTRWASKREEGQWYTIDLGASRKIYQINLLWEGSYGKEYDLQVSDDPTFATFKTVVAERKGAAGWKYHVLTEPVEGRYVRMQGILRGNTKYGYSIFEFEVVGDAERTNIEELKFASDAFTVLKDQKKAVALVTKPAQIDEGSVVFTSSDPAVAKVNNKGVVTGITLGTATITATSAVDSSIKASCGVTVTDYNGAPIPVSNLEVVGGIAQLAKGTTAKLDATIAPDDAAIPNVRWTSSDESVLLVTNEGLIKALALGTAVIRGTSVANPEFRFEQEIKVFDASVETVKTLIAAIGVVTLNSKAAIDEARTAYNALTAEQKALVENYGVLTAAEARYVEIVSGVTLDKNSLNLAPGGKEQLTATVTPDTALNKTVSWTSSNPAIATVSEDGQVTAIAGGSAVITATTEDGGFTATCTVTVSSYVAPPSNTTTKTEKNPDGSTTKTVTDKKTGKVTETTTYPDGTKIVATTPKDGNATIEVTVPKDKDSVAVTIPTKEQPKPGEVAVIVHEDGTREVIKTSVSTEEGLRVTLTGNAKLEIIDNSRSFADVPADHWAADAIAFATSRELFAGGDGGFQPEGDMSRAMLFTVLARLDGQDTTGGANWYEKSMDWAKETGISDGTNPDASITRESLAVMLYRYAGSPDTAGMALGEFGDRGEISSWAEDAMLWCVGSGILKGSSNMLNPNGTATRAEVATMLQRFISL